VDIWEIDKLELFLIFLIPGFISIKVYDLLVPREQRDFSNSLYEIIGYSALNFAALSWWIILILSDGFYINHRFWHFLSVFFIMFTAPIIWPLIFLKISTWAPIAKHIIHPVRKPWDYVFMQRKSFWVIIYLKNGTKIGGVYSTNSFASSYPAKEQIYLEEVWELDEEGKRFIEPIKRSKGIIMLGEDISMIEFFE
jgi:hypothetical protein